MKFLLLDRILDLQPGQYITAHKALTRAEEYLDDHFPKLPIMPGVLMLEAMYQASAWLVRATDDFAHSMVVLHEVRNVKYNGLVEPGQLLEMRAEILKRNDDLTTLKTEGTLSRAALPADVLLSAADWCCEATTSPTKTHPNRNSIAT